MSNYIGDVMSVIEKSMMELIRQEPWWAYFIMEMRIIYRDDIQTLGVNVTDKINLYVNKNFFSSLNALEQVDVLKHECMHPLFSHITRSKELVVFETDDGDKITKNSQHRLFNMAADYAINEFLPNLPMIHKYDEKGKIVEGKSGKPCLVEDLIEECKSHNIAVERRQTMEYYYGILCKLLKADPSRVSNAQTLDDHDLWEEGDDDGTTGDIIKSAVSNATCKAVGNTPDGMQSIINDILHPKVSWNKVLRMFFAKSNNISRRSTRSKINRRYGIDFPGHKKNRKLHILSLVDTSGSMSDEILEQVASELYYQVKCGARVTIIEFDAKVHGVYELKEKQLVTEFKGRGGTVFSPAFKKAEEFDADGIVVFSDMGVWGKDKFKKPKVPVLWVCTEGVKPPCDWGKTIDIE